MERLREELRKMLYFEYLYSDKANKDNTILTESNGVPDIINNLAMLFKTRLYEWLEKNDRGGTFNFTNKDIKEINSKNLFFKSLNAEIEIKLYTIDGGNFAYQRYNGNNFSGGVLKKCKIEGLYKINPNNIASSVSHATALFAHELVHAYEDYQRQSGNREDFIDNIAKYGYMGNRYRHDQSQPIDKRKLSYIIYYLTPQEVRAYCTQIIKACEEEISMCSSSEQAFNVIQQNTIWQNYEVIGEYIKAIANQTTNCSTDDIEKWWEDIMDKKWGFDKIVQYLKKNYDRAKKQLVNNISKKIANIALSNDKWHYLGDDDKLIEI
mgnify:CR=1 FL=1